MLPTTKPAFNPTQQGFVLVPVMLLLLVSLMLLLGANQELQQRLAIHQFKLRADCLNLERQLLMLEPKPATSSNCPACLPGLNCL